MRPSNERWRYTVTPSLIGWEHTQNDHCKTAVERWRYTVMPSLIGWAHTQNDHCKLLLKLGHFISIHISYKSEDMITYPCSSYSWSLLIKGIPHNTSIIYCHRIATFFFYSNCIQIIHVILILPYNRWMMASGVYHKQYFCGEKRNHNSSSVIMDTGEPTRQYRMCHDMRNKTQVN